MMRRIGLLALAGLIAVLSSKAAQAGCLEDFWNQVEKTTMRVNCWPKPHIYPDREAVRAPFAIMVANGWKRQNTLGEYYFDSNGMLTDSGRLKVHWILKESAHEDRTVYVYNADNPSKTMSRVAAVRNEILRIQPENDDPQVVVTDIRPEGWPAERVGRIGAKFNESMPAPVLPASTDENNK